MNRPEVKKGKLSPSAVSAAAAAAVAGDTITNDSNLELPSNGDQSEQSQQQFCVRWSSHQINLQRAFPKLLMSESFVDVTLACEHNMIKCHKVVLSASSSYFEKLLTSTTCKHPVIFIKDMKFSEMKTLVDFMYKGQVNVNKDELKSLMKSAEALEIRGLNGTNRTYLDKTSQQCVAAATEKQPLSPQSETRETSPCGRSSSLATDDLNDNDDQNDNEDADATSAIEATAIEPSKTNGGLSPKSLSSNQHNRVSLSQPPPLLKSSATISSAASLRNGHSTAICLKTSAPNTITTSNRASSSSTETAINVSNDENLFGFLNGGNESDSIRSNSENRDHQPDIDMDETDDYEMNDETKYNRSAGGGYEDHEDSVYDDDDIEQNVLNRVTCHISEESGSSQMEMFSPNYQPGPDFMMSMMGTRRIRRTEDELKKAAEQITKGQTFQMVSDRFNIPISTIRFYMARKGILPRRKRGRSCSATNAASSLSSGSSHESRTRQSTQANESRRNNCISPSDPPYHIAHYKLPMLNENFK